MLVEIPEPWIQCDRCGKETRFGATGRVVRDRAKAEGWLTDTHTDYPDFHFCPECIQGWETKA